MRLLMLGVSHRTADVELRQRLALAGEALDRALDAFHARFPVAEAVMVSTCNRTELYVARPVHEKPDIDELRGFFAGMTGVDAAALASVTIHREQEQAVTHLFGVCAGLDSMVLGETQVLGQVRRAYEHCAARRVVGPMLHQVFQDALAAARRVRAQTGIDAGRLSVGSTAVDFARRIFERFDDKTVLGIGAGEMAKLTLRHLVTLRPGRLLLTNRTAARALTLAQSLGLGASARPFEDLDELLVEADLVVTGTGSTLPIITAARLEPLLRRRRNRPLVFIDIALPRDVEARVASLRNVYLYDLDDLRDAIDQTHDQRHLAAQRAHELTHEAARACLSQLQHRDLGQLVKALRRRLLDLGQIEQERTLRKLTTAAPHQIADLLAEHDHRLIGKILHQPLEAIHARNGDPAGGPSLGFYAAALRKLFGLEPVSEIPKSEDRNPK